MDPERAASPPHRVAPRTHVTAFIVRIAAHCAPIRVASMEVLEGRVLRDWPGRSVSVAACRWCRRRPLCRCLRPCRGSPVPKAGRSRPAAQLERCGARAATAVADPLTTGPADEATNGSVGAIDQAPVDETPNRRKAGSRCAWETLPATTAAEGAAREQDHPAVSRARAIAVLSIGAHGVRLRSGATYGRRSPTVGKDEDMRYLHTMVRVSQSRRVPRLLLRQARPPGGAPPREPAGPLHAGLPRRRREPDAQVELTYNWDPEVYTGGRNFGHLAYSVDDIYATCQRLMDKA